MNQNLTDVIFKSPACGAVSSMYLCGVCTLYFCSWVAFFDGETKCINKTEVLDYQQNDTVRMVLDIRDECFSYFEPIPDYPRTTAERIKEKRLRDYGYDDNISHSKISNEPTVIKVKLNVTDFDFDNNEYDHGAKIIGTLFLEWNDIRFKWYPHVAEVDPEMVIYYHFSEIWWPVFSLQNGSTINAIDIDNKLLRVTHDGSVSWNLSVEITVPCQQNLQWPFEEYTCNFTLSFGNDTHGIVDHLMPLTLSQNENLPLSNDTNMKLTMDNEYMSILSGSLSKNQKWKLLKFGASDSNKFCKEKDCSKKDPGVTFAIVVLPQNPLSDYFLVTVIFLFGSVSLILFCIKPLTKLRLNMKILLASVDIVVTIIFWVYFQIILESEGQLIIPAMLNFYCFNAVLVGISLFFSVVALTVCRLQVLKGVSNHFDLPFLNTVWLQILNLMPEGSLACLRRKNHPVANANDHELNPLQNKEQNQGQNQETEKDIVFSKELGNDLVQNQLNELTENQGKVSVAIIQNSEWLRLASVIDKILFLIYIVVIGIYIILFLLL